MIDPKYDPDAVNAMGQKLSAYEQGYEHGRRAREATVCAHDNAIKREGEVQRWCGDCGAIYVDDYAGGEWLLPGVRS